MTSEFDGMPIEEAERILHARGVALSVRMYQKLGYLSHLALLMYGGNKVFDTYAQSLCADFLGACLRQPKSERRDPEDAIIYMQDAEHSNTQIVAILFARLEADRLAATAAALNVSTQEIETVIVRGIAVLLNAQQMLLVQTLAFTLQFGTTILQQMDAQG